MLITTTDTNTKMEADDPDSLEGKRKLFSRLENIPSRSTHDGNDELDSKEDHRRMRHRRFFASPGTSPSPKRASPLKQKEIPEGDTVKTPMGNGKETTIKATQSSSLRKRGRPSTLFDDGGEVVRETPSATSERSLAKQASRSIKNLSRTDRESTESPLANSKRRKKEDSVKLRPDRELIFRGLRFHFVPDNDIAPARRIRIGKSREYGAAWERNVEDATHLIVDKGIAYNDVEGLVKKQPHVIVVSEEYPVECIQFKALLDAKQKRYLLPGQDAPPEAEPAPDVVIPPSVEDLPIKTPQRVRGWDLEPSEETPPRISPLRPMSSPLRQRSSQVVLDLQPSEESVQRLSVTPTPESRKTPEQATSKKVEHAADELSSCIDLMVEYRDLPLDADDDEDKKPTAAADSDDEAGPSPEKKKVVRRDPKPVNIEERFACHNAGAKSAEQENPNARTIQILQSMLDYYTRVNDQWRVLAYRRAIATLKRQNFKVTTEEEAVQLPSIGQSLAAKIEEIATTDTLQRLEYAGGSPTDAALQLFLGIHGVGTKTAQQWIGRGHRTLEDLLKHVSLTANQKIGVEHYKDLNTRVPRQEMTRLGDVVIQAAAAIDPAVEITIGGSYRRGAKDSGDIDFIITRPDTTSVAELRPFLYKLVRKLEDSKFLVARLASGGYAHSSGDSSLWHGCCVLPGVGIWRRIDLLLVPESQMGGALIYFTGDDIFNRSLRLLARKKGMRLNQRGLYKRGPAGGDDGELVEGRCEKKIFEVLGVKWRPPGQRWC